ncbi:PspA/IM30 family protein [Roseibium sp. HPY-6]|uniref:PspA/IM30 family protein n=1 Tax=Roseibium sp. HPY-6 TaxID=3229852 RepID=UPI00338ED16C
MLEPLVSHLKALLDAGADKRQPSLASLGGNLRDAAASVRAAQAALAKAKAEQQQDRNRLKQISASIEDLENRARIALLKGVDTLAHEAAEAIAVLEDEKSELETAIKRFDEDLVALTDQLHRAQGRLRALKRGERTVAVRQQINKAQSLGSVAGQSALTRAEDQLEDILEQQEKGYLADRAFAELAPVDQPQAVIEKLAEADCGVPVRVRANDVLERIRSELPLLIETDK